MYEYTLFLRISSVYFMMDYDTDVPFLFIIETILDNYINMCYTIRTK